MVDVLGTNETVIGLNWWRGDSGFIKLFRGFLKVKKMRISVRTLYGNSFVDYFQGW